MATTIAPPMGTGSDEITDKGQLKGLSTKDIRALIRAGRYRGTSSDLGVGYAQATFVAVPERHALDFMTFCQRNPQPVPILEVIGPRTSIVQKLAPGADVRTDMAKYRVIKAGRVAAEPNNIVEYWQDDYIGFLIGCSCSFDWVLREAGVPDRGLATYVTNRDCTPAGVFKAKLWVSVRPVHHTQVSLAAQVSSRFPAFHGTPVHYGDPSVLGVDFKKTTGFPGAKPFEVKPDEVAVYWACSITSTQMALDSGVDMIVSYPGFMLMTDTLARTMAISG
jgi:uncharacterized protein YcsI (UPF0317 family)